MTLPVIVPLSVPLLDFAILGERDPLTAELASRPESRAMMLNRWGYAALARGQVLAAAGLFLHWPGRAEAWMLCSGEARPRELVAICRHVRAVIENRQRDPSFRRIEAHVRADAPWRASFARALGLEAEARLKAWDPAGRDHFLYARVVRI